MALRVNTDSLLKERKKRRRKKRYPPPHPPPPPPAGQKKRESKKVMGLVAGRDKLRHRNVTDRKNGTKEERISLHLQGWEVEERDRKGERERAGEREGERS